jgi:hypothetical protein
MSQGKEGRRMKNLYERFHKVVDQDLLTDRSGRSISSGT